MLNNSNRNSVAFLPNGVLKTFALSCKNSSEMDMNKLIRAQFYLYLDRLGIRGGNFSNFFSMHTNNTHSGVL